MERHNWDTSMRPIMLQTGYLTTMIEDSLEAEIVRVEMDIINQPKDSFRFLYKGWTYGISAFADWRVEDLDIEVYKDVDGKWILIEKDDSTDNDPLIFVTPSFTGLYRILIKVYKYSEGFDSAHYGLIIFH
jgi:hypothetical protein|tara:strand:+ start:1287 stop:1679 length:393 start_codon:yes stop_codon:yes gene_type:complete